MINIRHRRLTETGANEFASEICTALVQLAKAYNYARNVQTDPWEFAVEISQLMALGLTTSDLRWLVKKGYIKHAREVTRLGDSLRGFLPMQNNTSFTKDTCFVPTESGLLLAKSNQTTRAVSSIGMDDTTTRTGLTLIPNWDHNGRTLYLGERIVKRYAVPSPNQQAILAAFQEQGWIRYIDDPIPPSPEQNQKIRLRDTIKSLNAHQKSPLIRFHGDGSGTRIRWESVDVEASPLSVSTPRLWRAA